MIDGATATLVRAANQDAASGEWYPFHLHIWGNDGTAASGTGTLGIKDAAIFNGNYSGALTIECGLAIKDATSFTGNSNNAGAGSFTIKGKTTIANIDPDPDGTSGIFVKSIDKSVTTFAGPVEVERSARVWFINSSSNGGAFVFDSDVTLVHHEEGTGRATSFNLARSGDITLNGDVVTDSARYVVTKSTGSIYQSFVTSLVRYSVIGADIELVPGTWSGVYTGAGQEPGAVVSTNGVAVPAADGYTVDYADNVNAGTNAVVTVTAVGQTFTIAASGGSATNYRFSSRKAPSPSCRRSIR